MKLLHSMFEISGDNIGGKAVSLSDETASHADFTLCFNPDHPIYQAHFPGKPITPGVCIVKVLGELLELKLGRRLELKEIKNLKFVSPISPIANARVDVRFRKIDASEHVKVQGAITRGETVYTKFSLIFHE